jgi:hypothetical protein
MKRNLLILLIIFSLTLSAQDTTNISFFGCHGSPSWVPFQFENYAEENNFYIAPTTGNLWAIGIPVKTMFDAAYSVPRAMVTDTVNPYPVNNSSSFYVIIKGECSAAYGISFHHRMNTDSLQDGGTIEISDNGGNTWINIIDYPYQYNGPMNVYSSSSTVSSMGKPGFTGTFPWKTSSFDFYNPANFDLQIFVLKFTFASDGTQINPKDGWMIDDLEVTSAFESIDGHSNDQKISIYPNPATSSFNINTGSALADLNSVSIFNYLGEKMKEVSVLSGKSISTDGLDPGIYYVSIQNNNRVVTKKMIIQK